MDALEFVGISDMALEPASALSQGDLKRLEVARAIATEPELLLLDEPLGGLNPAESELLAKSIRRLHKGGRFGRLHSEGPAVLMIEHKLKELMSIVDRVIVIDYGEIIADGAPAEVVKNPKVSKPIWGASMPLLEVKNLRVRYDKAQILNGVSLAVNEGEFVGLVGPERRRQVDAAARDLGPRALRGAHEARHHRRHRARGRSAASPASASTASPRTRSACAAWCTARSGAGRSAS